MYGKKSRSLDSKHPPIYEKNEDIDSDGKKLKLVLYYTDHPCRERHQEIPRDH